MKKKFSKQCAYTWITRGLILQFFLLLSIVSLAGISHTAGQGVLQRRISLSVDNMKIKNVLNMIERNAATRFGYQPHLVDSLRKVTLRVENTPVLNVLNSLFDSSIMFSEIGEMVIIKSANSLMIEALQVKGKVTDAKSGETMTGVHVSVKGTTHGTVTDGEGNFSLEVEDPNTVLVFSFVGYLSKEVPLNSNSTLNVQLESDQKQLEEVVVVGYGTQKKIAVAAAISSVSMENIKAVTMGTVSEALQGKAAGVEVVNNSNSPGGDISVRIRGVGSVSNSIQPLYVVDGMPVSGGISFLNNKDIAAIDILKDAAGAAIYGSRGATGVVLITTKSGRPNQKFSVEIDASAGLQNAGHLIRTMGTAEFARLRDTFLANNGKGEAVPAGMRTSPGTDWMKEILKKNAVLQNHSITVSGGTDRIAYSTSLNLFEQNGIARSSDYRRINYRLNTVADVTDRLRITANMIATSSRRHYIFREGDMYNSLFTSALTMDPYTPVYKSATDTTLSHNNNEYSLYTGGIFTTNSRNPAGLVNRNFQEDKNLNFLGSLFASYELAKGLTYKAGAGVEYNSLNSSVFNPDYYESANFNSNVNDLSKTNGGLLHYYIENTLNLQRELSKNQELSLLLGSTYEHYRYNSITGSVSGLPGNDSHYRYLSYGTSGMTNAENIDEWAIRSYFMRATYSYKQKYFLTLTNRADGSSKFVEGKKWGVFPSVSAAWIVSEEGFFKNKILTFFKIRAGWGKIGNQNIPMASFLNTWRNDAKYNFGGTLAPGYGILRPGNPAVTWETTRDANLGIEFDLFNKISGSLDFYEREVTDLLLAIQPAAYTGLYNQGIEPIGVLTNAGTIRNRGIDLLLNYEEKAGKWGYNLGGVFSLVRNQVLDLGPMKNLDAGLVRNVGGSAERTTKGLPIAQFYGFKTLGIFQNEAEIQNYKRNGELIQPNAAPGDFKFAVNPANSAGKSLSDEDKQFIGNPLPDFTYGLNFGLRYGGLDLAAYFYGVYGNDVLESQRSLIANTNNSSNNLREGLVDQAWHGEGTSNTVPRITTTGSNNNFGRVSDAYLTSGTYLRCRNINIGYEIKPDAAKGSKLSSMRIYAGIQNAFTLTDYTGFDPAISNSDILQTGIDYGGYPVSRVYLIGVNVKF